MNNKVKLRSEIKDEYKWDLTTIYENNEKWEEDFKKAEDLLKEIPNYKDNFLDSANNLLDFLEFDEKVDRLISKLYYYAHLNYDSDTLCDQYKKMNDRVIDLSSRYGELTSFFTPSILSLDNNVLEKYYLNNPKLLDYKFMFDDIIRYKKHTLSEDKEKMIAMLLKALDNSAKTYQTLIYSDIKFDKVKDENEKEIEFNDNVYSTLIKSKNRRVRRDAFMTLFNGYKNYKNVIADLFNGNKESEIALAKIRNYKSAVMASLFSENINIEVYNNLVKCINDNMDVIYKYYRVKKEILGLDQLHIYDTYVELVGNYDKKYSFSEAKDLALKSLSILGEDYIKNIKRAFDERWIDVYYNKGKYTGAYSSGFYDTNPFVLLNYKETIDDVSTLVHELGHSMHTYYSCKNNKYVYSNYEIFVAEVASTVNEMLLANYMLKNSKNKEEKLSILNHIIDMFKATLYRQTMFAEFEYEMYDKKEKNESLTSDYISQSYYEILKKYYGKEVILDEEIKYEWMRIPHFYYNFYVYKYATGLASACYIVDGILNNKKNALENYLSFLKTGGSKYPLDALKVAGVDMTDKTVIESAIKMFDKYIDEFTLVYNS